MALIRRLLILVLAVGLLSVTGIARLEFPWGDPDFQISGTLVLAYLLWAGAESGRRRPRLDLPVLGMYSVLLVSVLDSFLIRLTVFPGVLGSELWPVRWAGLGLFVIGSGIRLAPVAGRTSALRAGRALQLAGLPAALGSVAGLVVGLLPAMMTVRMESASLPADGEGSLRQP
ncbi:hypothetical protein JW921_09720 [Candidatus Fermentibacterales bacterium]|nr:hypothetical protein [Candidatus Fermentibacterales bacterium]